MLSEMGSPFKLRFVQVPPTAGQTARWLCSALLPSNAKFCTSCGSFLPSSLLSPAKRANQSPKRQPKNTGLRNESDRRQVLGNRRSSKFQPVSYTHLTLPTKRIV